MRPCCAGGQVRPSFRSGLKRARAGRQHAGLRCPQDPQHPRAAARPDRAVRQFSFDVNIDCKQLKTPMFVLSLRSL